jgi:membrane protein YqaA with SNARE-associated domain
MDADSLAGMGPAALLLVTLLYGVLSATIPLFNTELFVVGAGVAAAEGMRAPIVVAITVGTMIGKVAVYAGAERLVAAAKPRARERVDRAVAALRRWPALTWPIIFVSALVGLPPFYAVTVASGALRLGLPLYVAVSSVGRLLRFGALMYAPHLLRGVTA